MAFTNATAAEVLQAYIQLHPPGTTAWVDPKAQELCIGRSRFFFWGTQMLKRISGLFR